MIDDSAKVQQRGAVQLSTCISFSLFAVCCVLFAYFGPIRVVVSDSMAPTLNRGDALLLRRPEEALQPGTIVTFQMASRLITHRITEVVGSAYRTQGDNSQRPDPWLLPHQDVVGVVALRIRYLGYLLFYLRTPIGWLTAVVLPAVLVTADEVKSIRAKARASIGRPAESE